MKKISFFLVIVLLGCQDIITPNSPSLTGVDTKTSDTNLRQGNSASPSLLTEDDRQLILSSLERSGRSLTSEQLDLLLRIIEVTIPIVKSLEDEMPASLRNATGRLDEIIKQDPEAAAFAVKVKRAIEDKITIPDNVLACDWELFGIYLFQCIKTYTWLCEYNYDYVCFTFENIVNVLGCVTLCWD